MGEGENKIEGALTPRDAAVADAQPTPGPWHFVPDNAGLMSDHGYGLLYGDPDNWGWEKNLFVSVGCSHNVERALGKGVAEANARLIAAAPDLLEALRRADHTLTVHGKIDGDTDLHNFIREAAAKAGG